MGIIYLINPKKGSLKYIYNNSDLKKRLDKNKLRPENKRIVPKANIKNIKFGRFKGNKNSLYNRYKKIFGDVELRVVVSFDSWDETKNFEKIVKNECFSGYKKLINTLEWLDDEKLNMDLAERLILERFKIYKNI
jgi:hypothetical protein